MTGKLMRAWMRYRPRRNAATRHADASGRSPRASSMPMINWARLIPRSRAIASSAAQNSGSRAIEVAWPDRLTERFLSTSVFALHRGMIAVGFVGARLGKVLLRLGAAETDPVFRRRRLGVRSKLGLARLVEVDRFGHG